MIPIFESNLIFRLQVKATGGEDAKSKNVVFTAVSSHSTYKKGPPEKESLLSKKWCTCSNSRFLFHSPFVIICIYSKSTYPGSPNPTASLSFSKSGLPDHVLLNIVLKKVLIV